MSVADFRSTWTTSSDALAEEDDDDDDDAAAAAVGRGFRAGDGGCDPFRCAACDGNVTAAVTVFVLCACRATL